MILICEQCQARYLLASLMLGAEGRKVRCGVCSHTWFQPPVDETYEAPKSFQDHLDHEILEPIPEGVKPIPEGSSVPVVGRSKFKFSFKPELSKETIGSGLSSAAVFVLIFAGLVVFHKPLTHAWPKFDGLFSMIGLAETVPGEDLVFEHVTAKAKQGDDGKYILTLSGSIVNTGHLDAQIPPVLASLRKSETESGSSFSVPTDKTSIGPDAILPFSTTYENLPDDMAEVTVQFAVK